MTGNREFWEDRYARKELGWDIGTVSRPLKAYIDQIEDKNLKILVPGAGYGHEVLYLHGQGFQNVFAIDIASRPLLHIQEKIPLFPRNHLLRKNFFDVCDGGYDLILEQTFFCSLPPANRQAYVEKMFELLQDGGKVAGLFFDFPLTDKGPPFGGSMDDYRALFSPSFKIRTLERAYNSIPQRQGSELFFIFEK